MRGLKVIIFTKSVDGGTGTYIESLLRLPNLYKQRLIIKVFALEKPSYRKIKKEKERNFSFFAPQNHYPPTYKLNLKNPLSFLKEIVWTKKVIKEEKPNILFGIDIHANLLIMLNKLFFFSSIPVILTTHTPIAKTLEEKSSFSLAPFLNAAIGFLYKKGEAHIAVSKNIANELKRHFKLKEMPKVIPNGITLAKKKNPTPLNPQKPVFINVARLVKQKDQANLIKAFALLLQSLPKAKLYIVGDGEERKNLEKMIKKLKVKKQIKFLGWVKDTNALLDKANIFVLSSIREGLPYSLLEAMAASKAIIATDVPSGPSWVLGKGRFGILVPPQNPNRLKGAMLKLGRDEETYRKFAKAAFKRVKDFSEKTMLENYKEAIYETLKS